jgi:hypothetical protein
VTIAKSEEVAGFEILTAVTEEYNFQGCNAVYLGRCPQIFRREIPPPQLLDDCLLLVSCLTYPLTLKTEAKRSSETSVDFCRTTWLCNTKADALLL